ncbi:MAG TPA: hypothetical protein VMM12_00720 [Longimicrobiales bacterium]|nr:hypothetical protein [Longimicrobiales bacterium]
MVTVLSLWLPILVSAVLVFAASSVIHMFLGYHANDYVAVPGEEVVGASIRAANVPPGNYMMPYAGSMKVMNTPEFKERMARGPVAMITVLPSGQTGMGKQLASWFVFTIAVSVVAAYVAGRALTPEAEYLEVFRFAGTAAFAAYALGTWSESIWYGRKWTTTLKNSADGVVYALITAGVFGWMWPGT